MALMLAFPNRADDALISGGSWSAGLAALQRRDLGDVARSAGLTLAATQFTATLDQRRPLNFVGLIRHNLSVEARVRVRLGLDAVGDVYDSGWLDAWPRSIGASRSWFGANWWTGRKTAEDLAGLSPDYALRIPVVLARLITVEIDDQANPAGYVQIGRLFAADGWAPLIGNDWGASLAFEDETVVERNPNSGAEFFGESVQRRVWRARLSHIGTTEAHTRAAALLRHGVAGEVYLLADDADGDYGHLRNFLARYRTLSPIEHAGYDRHVLNLELSEIL